MLSSYLPSMLAPDKELHFVLCNAWACGGMAASFHENDTEGTLKPSNYHHRKLGHRALQYGTRLSLSNASQTISRGNATMLPTAEGT